MGKYSRETPMSEMDSQRALLDTLMGINRNQDRDEDDIRDFRDKRVCRCYLIDLCPHGRTLLGRIIGELFVILSVVDLFQNTKADMGPCKLFHSEVSDLLMKLMCILMGCE